MMFLDPTYDSRMAAPDVRQDLQTKADSALLCSAESMGLVEGHS